MRTLNIFLICFLAVFSSAIGQIDQVKIAQIDSLFLDWNQPNHPGGSIGVMLKGEIIYQKSFGLASLEYLVPNNNGTIYNIASVSKQFTGMAIVLLEEKGILELDDDIREHLPWVPDFGKTVTIRHMLNHTSGLRSLHALLSLAGWRGDDSRTNEDLNRFVKDQKELNFEPGSEYLYCNTGFMLLATLVEEKTGESFPKWMKDNVFNPLGMNDSYVEDAYDRVVPGNSTSYYGNQASGFDRAVEYWGYVGSGNIHSTTSDLLVWLENYRTPQNGWENAFKKMVETVPFNSGTMQTYALGVGVNDYYGHTRIGHGGAIGGFRSQIQSYPDDQLSIVILTNFSSGNPGGNLNEIANIILDITPEPRQPRADRDVPQYRPKSAEVNALVGTYYSPELRTIYELRSVDGEIVAFHARHGEMSTKWSTSEEIRVRGALGTISIVKSKKGKVSGFKASNGRVRNLWFEKQ